MSSGTPRFLDTIIGSLLTPPSVTCCHVMTFASHLWLAELKLALSLPGRLLNAPAHLAEPQTPSRNLPPLPMCPSHRIDTGLWRPHSGSWLSMPHTPEDSGVSGHQPGLLQMLPLHSRWLLCVPLNEHFHLIGPGPGLLCPCLLARACIYLIYVP